MGKHLHKRKSINEWLKEEFGLGENEWDIIWKTSKNRYRIRQFTPTWWILGLIVPTMMIICLLPLVTIFMSLIGG